MATSDSRSDNRRLENNLARSPSALQRERKDREREGSRGEEAGVGDIYIYIYIYEKEIL